MPKPHITSPNDVHWNDPYILRQAGTTPDAIIGLMARHGQTAATAHAIYQWGSRRRIPDRWRTPLIYCLLREGRIKLGDLFQLGDPRRTEKVRDAYPTKG